ncbi:hypothetical protein U0070_017461 [Myodes glareolus]|uniref:Uncharacterized protein n=1 Tax=Myodes glareolus TaxID=447135 RepID=A0AAW0HGR2_MYOGA
MYSADAPLSPPSYPYAPLSSAASFLLAPPNPSDPGNSSAHEPTGIEGVGTVRAVGGATLRSEPPKPVKSGKGSKEGQDTAESEKETRGNVAY